MSDTLKWREPGAFAQAFERRVYGPPPWWRALLWMLGVACVFPLAFGVGVWLHGKQQFTWPQVVGAGLVFGWLFAYALPWLAQRSPREVWITPRGIGRNTLQAGAIRQECWTWNQIQSCTLESHELAGRRWPTLRIQAHDGAGYRLALAEHLPPETVAEHIGSLGYAAKVVR